MHRGLADASETAARVPAGRSWELVPPKGSELGSGEACGNGPGGGVGAWRGERAVAESLRGRRRPSWAGLVARRPEGSLAGVYLGSFDGY